MSKARKSYLKIFLATVINIIIKEDNDWFSFQTYLPNEASLTPSLIRWNMSGHQSVLSTRYWLEAGGDTALWANPLIFVLWKTENWAPSPGKCDCKLSSKITGKYMERSARKRISKNNWGLLYRGLTHESSGTGQQRPFLSASWAPVEESLVYFTEFVCPVLRSPLSHITQALISRTSLSFSRVGCFAQLQGGGGVRDEGISLPVLFL